MRIELDIDKSLEENAAAYFEKAKKARSKLDGVKSTIARYEEELKQLQAARERGEVIAEEQDDDTTTTLTNKSGKWFDKFKWFLSSEGFLVVAGRDAATNEIIVNKYVDNNDIVFHTEMAGSPFVVIKMNKDEANELLGDLAQPDITTPQKTLDEAATFCLVHGRPWKLGLASDEVFSVGKSQLSKKSPEGISLPKGSFYVDGKRTTYHPSMEYAVGIVGTFVLGASIQTIEHYDKWCVHITQGSMKTGMATKEIRSELLRFHKDVKIDLDSIMGVIPAGGVTVQKRRKTKEEL